MNQVLQKNYDTPSVLTTRIQLFNFTIINIFCLKIFVKTLLEIYDIDILLLKNCMYFHLFGSLKIYIFVCIVFLH